MPTLLVARTDAESAKLITSDIDLADQQFLTGERTPEGFFRLKDGTGLDHCIARGLAFAEHADLLWWETSHPDLDDARAFAEAVHAVHPGKLLQHIDAAEPRLDLLMRRFDARRIGDVD